MGRAVSGAGGASVKEASGAPGMMKADLAAGVNNIDLNQTVRFTRYQRVILPLDGFVFWVKADQLGPGAEANAMSANRVSPNAKRPVTKPANVVIAQGSLHISAQLKQESDEYFAPNRVTFTSLALVREFNDIYPDHLYIAHHEGQTFCFSQRGNFYKQAGLYHYQGDATYPTFATQVIDSAADLLPRELIVSNSLPIWLALNQIFPVYPSYLVPQNLRPPYAAVHIDDNHTEPMQSAPFYDDAGSRFILAKDRVLVTFYGVRNDAAQDFLDAVATYTMQNPAVMGVMNTPIVRDAKKTQIELGVLAQKKEASFEINYYQTRVREQAQQFILSAFINEFFSSVPVTF